MSAKTLLLLFMACLLFAFNASIGSTLTSKTGPLNARVWNFNFINSGPDAALGAQVDSFTLTQTFGASCTPVIATTFPIIVGDLSPGYSAPYSVGIDFTGCAATARFTLAQTFEANSGQTTAAVTKFNQFP
ncbi:MAG TPA: hypothetical protein VIX89_13415 [Bryobacteraceae bacterium]